jgi:hypothetical protein
MGGARTKEATMPALLPTLLIAAHVVLAADDQSKVPALDYGPSCRAAVATATIATRDADSCKQDEETARSTLQKDWGKYTVKDRGHCVQLTKLGGPPSYVELLTCLELAKESAEMPDEMPINNPAER